MAADRSDTATPPATKVNNPSRAARARPFWGTALALALVIGVSLGRFAGIGGPAPDGPPAATGISRSATDPIDALEAAVEQQPTSSDALVKLGLASLAKFTETADPAWLARARSVIDRAVKIDPVGPAVLLSQGLRYLAEHDFERALDAGRAAAAANPGAVEPLGVVVDALIELGRYDEAVEAAQQMVDTKPGLAAYARVSYLRELHGDHAGAVDAMTQALRAASFPADIARVQTLLGDLHRLEGNLADAETSYKRALARKPRTAGALIGLARVEVARGDLDGARSRLESTVKVLPLPEAVGLLADVLSAAGDQRGARAQVEVVRSIETLNRASGISVDLELALFEANHARDEGGRPAEAIQLATQAQASRPTIFTEDALGWALRQAGRPAEALAHARNATARGTRHAELWWHLAAIEADLEMSEDAARHLGTAFDINPHLNPRDLPEAEALGSRLGVAPAPASK